MGHVVLLGDSIFDNGSYVPGQPDVVATLKSALPSGWSATLLARDGAVAADVHHQLDTLPASATHVVLSVGGNDALRASSLLHAPVRHVSQALELLAGAVDTFADDYRSVLDRLSATSRPVIICSIYDEIPTLDRSARAGLALYNDIIIRQTTVRRFQLIDLRLVCTDFADYSAISPIEPSHQGGLKIARVIARVVSATRH